MSRAIAVACVICAGCGGGDDAPAPDAFDPDAPHVMATVDPDVIAPGGMFVLNVTVDHFTLEPINGQPAEPNHGHYHVFLDDMDSYFASDSTVHQPLTIPAEAQVGDHTLTVRLVHADHSDHVPAASTHVSLRVE